MMALISCAAKNRLVTSQTKIKHIEGWQETTHPGHSCRPYPNAMLLGFEATYWPLPSMLGSSCRNFANLNPSNFSGFGYILGSIVIACVGTPIVVFAGIVKPLERVRFSRMIRSNVTNPILISNPRWQDDSLNVERRAIGVKARNARSFNSPRSSGLNLWLSFMMESSLGICR